MPGLSSVTLSLALSTHQARMEEWHQCLLEEAPEIHMLLHEAVRGKTATVVDTAETVDLEVPGVVMEVEAEDPWVLLLHLAIGDAVKGLALTVVEEVATEVGGAATSGIGHLRPLRCPQVKKHVYRVFNISLFGTRTTFGLRPLVPSISARHHRILPTGVCHSFTHAAACRAQSRACDR